MNRTILALSIVLVAGLLIRSIAARKNEELAGPATYRLPEERGVERDALERILASLENFEQTRLVRDLRRLDAEEALWVAPYLPGERQAVFVDSLGWIRRIYVDRGDLLMDPPPFAELDVPEEWRRSYALIRLGGTLYHELQHYEGELDEAVVYGRESEWYQSLNRTNGVRTLEGTDLERTLWAIESAILGADAAAAAAGAVSPP